MFMNNQNDPNKKLTITTLLAAVKNNRIDQIRNSLQRYGIPKSGIKTTDYSILKLAIERKKIEIAKLLINAGCRVNMIENDPSYTPLGMAIKIENEELTTLLLEKQATLGATNNSKLSALHLAAQHRSLKMLQFLLRIQTNINQISNGKTAFQIFLENTYNLQDKKHIDIIRLFWEKGASMNFKVNGGQFVLHLIVQTKQIDLIQKVLHATNDVNETNTNKDTALHVLLKEKIPEDNIVALVKLFIHKGAKINIPNNSGDTAYHLAAKYKYLKVLKIFMTYPWDVNWCNNNGNTVLHIILQNSEEFSNNEQYFQIVNHILQNNSLKLAMNKQGETLLYIAASNKQNRIMNILLTMPGVDVNHASGSSGFNPLCIFIKHFVEKSIVPGQDDIDIVKKMISKGADPTFTPSHTKYSPMHFALQLKNRDIILNMLNSNFDFNKFQSAQGKSILHFLSSGQVDFTETEDIDMAKIAELCIKKGEKVDQLDSGLKTPLYWAVLERRKHMVKTLLEFGADPNLCDHEGGTILENLMKKETVVSYTLYHNYGSYLICDGITKKQIPLNIERDSEIAEMLLFNKAVAEKVSTGQLSIFHYCARNGYLEMLLKIIPYCKDADIRDSSKNTILHELLANNLNITEEIERQVSDIVTILLSKGAEVRALNEKNETPLHLAASGRHLKTSTILLERNAFSIIDVDSNGNSVMHFMCMLPVKTNDSIEKSLSELFFGRGLDVNSRNKHGMTPLLFAVESGSLNMLKILFEHGATLNCTEDINQDMPIHLAAKHNRQEIIEYLLQCGVDVNVRRKDRRTALHLSVAHNLPKVTRLLLENGADTDLKDINGKTPLHWACWYESLDNINELLDYGADVNVEDNFHFTPLMFTSRSNNTWTKLHYHVVKLRTANMQVSKRNEFYIAKWLNETNYFDAEQLRQFESAAVEETLLLEKVQIGFRTVLTDVLQMSANKLSVFKCNEDFQNLLYANDFKEKYPIYADLIRACYRKGIIRSDLMLSAKDAFRKILELALPDTCCDAIFYYLDNENLHNLEKSIKIKANKRKRFLEEINESIPAKRVRRISV